MFPKENAKQSLWKTIRKQTYQTPAKQSEHHIHWLQNFLEITHEKKDDLDSCFSCSSILQVIQFNNNHNFSSENQENQGKCRCHLKMQKIKKQLNQLKFQLNSLKQVYSNSESEKQEMQMKFQILTTMIKDILRKSEKRQQKMEKYKEQVQKLKKQNFKLKRGLIISSQEQIQELTGQQLDDTVLILSPNSAKTKRFQRKNYSQKNSAITLKRNKNYNFFMKEQNKNRK